MSHIQAQKEGPAQGSGLKWSQNQHYSEEDMMTIVDSLPDTQKTYPSPSFDWVLFEFHFNNHIHPLREGDRNKTHVTKWSYTGFVQFHISTREVPKSYIMKLNYGFTSQIITICNSYCRCTFPLGCIIKFLYFFLFIDFITTLFIIRFWRIFWLFIFFLLFIVFLTPIFASRPGRIWAVTWWHRWPRSWMRTGWRTVMSSSTMISVAHLL